MSESSTSPQQQAARDVISEAVRELTLVSDEARFQIHLFSLEAKRRWNEIEGKLRHLEAKVAEGSEDGDEPTRAGELSKAIRELLTEQGSGSSPSLPVRHLMNRDVHTCRPDQSLSEAAATMAAAKCSALPVVDERGRLVGMLSEHDICVGAVASGAALSDTPVAVAMQHDVVHASPDETIGNAAAAMRQHGLRHVAVADSDGQLVGMLCLGDLARKLESRSEPNLDAAWVAATVVNVYAR